MNGWRVHSRHQGAGKGDLHRKDIGLRAPRGGLLQADQLPSVVVEAQVHIRKASGGDQTRHAVPKLDPRRWTGTRGVRRAPAERLHVAAPRRRLRAGELGARQVECDRWTDVKVASGGEGDAHGRGRRLSAASAHDLRNRPVRDARGSALLQDGQCSATPGPAREKSQPSMPPGCAYPPGGGGGCLSTGLGLGSPSWWNQSWFYNPF